MGELVVIGSETFTLNNQGDSAPWGSEQHDLIKALIDIATSISNISDISPSSDLILNTAGAKNINGFLFSSSLTRAFTAPYAISRSITKAISSISADVSGVVTIVTSTPHNLNNLDSITIAGSNSTASVNGIHAITLLSPTSFTISVTPGSVTVPGTSGSFVVELVEFGTLFGDYSQQGWNFRQEALGDALVTFDVSTTGQVQYTPTLLTGTSYTGLIKFSAKTILQA